MIDFVLQYYSQLYKDCVAGLLGFLTPLIEENAQYRRRIEDLEQEVKKLKEGMGSASITHSLQTEHEVEVLPLAPPLPAKHVQAPHQVPASVPEQVQSPPQQVQSPSPPPQQRQSKSPPPQPPSPPNQSPSPLQAESPPPPHQSPSPLQVQSPPPPKQVQSPPPPHQSPSPLQVQSPPPPKQVQSPPPPHQPGPVQPPPLGFSDYRQDPNFPVVLKQAIGDTLPMFIPQLPVSQAPVVVPPPQFPRASKKQRLARKPHPTWNQSRDFMEVDKLYRFLVEPNAVLDKNPS